MLRLLTAQRGGEIESMSSRLLIGSRSICKSRDSPHDNSLQRSYQSVRQAALRCITPHWAFFPRAHCQIPTIRHQVLIWR